jgi:uncharacterized protein VirK/YbjX
MQKVLDHFSFCKKLFGYARMIHKPVTLKNMKRRIVFFMLGCKNRVVINHFTDRMLALNVIVSPGMLAVIESPYIHNKWTVEDRLEKVASHYETLSKTSPKLLAICLLPRQKIICLDGVSKGTCIAIDYAPWFSREGELHINVFQKDLRVATMAFSLDKKNDEVIAYIGAVQGIHSGVSKDESLRIFKELTKDFYGLRPRSLLLEALKVVARELGVKKLFGVSEMNRHHRHKYFNNNNDDKFKSDYNVFWEEHGAKLNDSGFYEISMTPAVKDLSEIASKKRSQYRRRYAVILSLASVSNLH